MTNAWSATILVDQLDPAGSGNHRGYRGFGI
jgi:hypothetical protein